jgi:carbon monoxide dehydrogenase subunit G
MKNPQRQRMVGAVAASRTRMQIRLHARHTFTATPARVFGLAVDPARFPACFRGCGPIPAVRRITAQQPITVGSTRELENSDGSRVSERITALQAPLRHAYTLTGLVPPFSWLVRAGHADWTFTAVAEGTHVQWRYDWDLAGPLAWPIAWPLLQGFMRTAMQRCLRAMAELA